jgi:hypothetical protein
MKQSGTIGKKLGHQVISWLLSGYKTSYDYVAGFHEGHHG